MRKNTQKFAETCKNLQTNDNIMQKFTKLLKKKCSTAGKN